MRKILVVLIALCAVFTYSCEKSVNMNDPKVLAAWGDRPDASGTPVAAYLQVLTDAFSQANAEDSIAWISSHRETGIPLLERVRAAVAENQAPDVVQTQGGILLAPFVESERILDLTEELSDIKTCEAAKNVMRWNDKIDGVAPLYSIAGLFVNETKFKELGLPIPKTIAQLETAAEALKNKGIIPFAADTADKRSLSYMYMYLVNRMGGDIFQQVLNRKIRFDSPIFVKAGLKIQEWANKGYFGAVPLTGNATDLMSTGQAGMQVSGTWLCGTYSDSTKTKGTIGFYPFPILTGGKGAVTDILGASEVAFVGVTKPSVKRELVDKFMHEAMSAEVLKKATGMLSSDPSYPPSDPLLGMAAQVFYKAKNLQFYWEKELPTTTTGPAVATTVQSFLLPDTDVQAACTKLEQTTQVEMGGVVEDW